MSYRLREGVNEYSVLTWSQDALEDAPTLSLFTQEARFSIAGIVQRALTVRDPFALRPNLNESGNAWWWIREALRDNAALSMLSDKALEGLVKIVIDALYEKVDE